MVIGHQERWTVSKISKRGRSRAFLGDLSRLLSLGFYNHETLNFSRNSAFSAFEGVHFVVACYRNDRQVGHSWTPPKRKLSLK